MPKAKTKQIRQSNVIEFPLSSCFPAKNSERIIRGKVEGSYVEDLGIKDGDEIVIDTFEAVGNGDLIVINSGEMNHIGIAKFVGGGKVRLDYIHKTETFNLSEIKIIGRVIYSERSWK